MNMGSFTAGFLTIIAKEVTGVSHAKMSCEQQLSCVFKNVMTNNCLK